MKKTAVVILAMILGSSVFAQGKYGKDSAECIKYLSYYSEYVKQGNLGEAAPFWRTAMSLCPPTSSQKLLMDGQKILRKEIVNTTDPARRQQLIDSLFMLNDLRAEYYPKYKASSMSNKAIDAINYLKNDKAKSYEMVSGIVNSLKGATSTNVFVSYMQLVIERYQEGSVTADVVMDTYNSLSEYMEQSMAKDIASAKVKVEELFINSGVASCDNLVALYTPRYEKVSGDKDALTNMVTMLSKSECFDTDIYLKAVESLYSVDPSAKSAYFLYKLYSSRDKNDEAAKALTEAIGLLDRNNPEEASLCAEYNMELATFYFKKLGQGAKAAEVAKTVSEMKAELAGKAYLLLGTIWGSQKCSGNEVESRAQFWVAVDYMNKAKEADPSLAEDANGLISQYRRYFPQQADAFMYDVIDGNSYTVSCNGLHASTTVRTNK